MIEVKIQILKYLPNTIHVQIDGEPDEWYDGTNVKIVYPAKHQKEIVIYHSNPVSKNSPWRNKNQKYKLFLNEKYLNPVKNRSYEIYSDTLKLKKMP